MTTRVEELKVSWRCRLAGHHRWVYPLVGAGRWWEQSRETTPLQVCGRVGCQATRELVTPDTEQTPPLPLMAVRELLRLRKWKWGAPLVRGVDEDGVFWTDERGNLCNPYPPPRHPVASAAMTSPNIDPSRLPEGSDPTLKNSSVPPG